VKRGNPEVVQRLLDGFVFLACPAGTVLDFALSKGASLIKPVHRTDYGGYSGYFADPDGHPWEVVVAPGIEVGEDRRVHLPD
jgi:hypothetical protein